MSYQELSPPATEPITLEETKLHLRIDGDEEDTLIQSLIAAARNHAEDLTGRCLATRYWRMSLDTLPDIIYVPVPPLQSVTQFSYIDETGAEQNLVEDTDFYIDPISEPGRIFPVNTWPTLANQKNVVTIDFEAGFITVPSSIKQAILLIIGHWYENREASGVSNLKELPMAVNSILHLNRVWRFA